MTRASIILATLLCAAPAAAQEAEPRPLVLDGVSGVWVPLAYAQRLEAYRLELPEVRAALRIAVERLELRGAESLTLRAAVDDARAQLATASQTIDGLTAIVRDLRAWWRDPVLWCVVGVVVGVAAMGAIALAVR